MIMMMTVFPKSVPTSHCISQVLHWDQRLLSCKYLGIIKTPIVRISWSFHVDHTHLTHFGMGTSSYRVITTWLNSFKIVFRLFPCIPRFKSVLVKWLLQMFGHYGFPTIHVDSQGCYFIYRECILSPFIHL